MNESQRLSLWMRFGQPLEPVIENYQQVFDGWQAGGVTGIVLGRLVFDSSEGKSMAVPAFTPNKKIYEDAGVEPPAPPQENLSEKQKLLQEALENAKQRGLELYVFCPDHGAGPGGKGHHLCDEKTLAARVARIADVMDHYPMIDGGTLDGPELGYEITPGHRSNIFEDLPESVSSNASELGFDYQAIIAAQGRLEKKLQSLKPSEIDLKADGGLFGAFQLFDSDPDLMAWLAFRGALLVDYHRRLKEALDANCRPIRKCVGARSACFAALNGYNFAEMGKLFDILMPKHYFFHRGFDGMYGTIGRYIQTLTTWNPGLTDLHAMKIVEALFGLRMPWIGDRLDLEMGFPSEFFEIIVKNETRKALAAVDDPCRVVPWVEAGREPHRGDPISAGDLHRILVASQEAGLQNFLYHNHCHLTGSEWAVISNLCGERWYDGKPGYVPPDGLAWETISHRGLAK